MKQKIKVDLNTQLCVSSVFLVLGLKKIIPSSLVSIFLDLNYSLELVTKLATKMASARFPWTSQFVYHNLSLCKPYLKLPLGSAWCESLEMYEVVVSMYVEHQWRSFPRRLRWNLPKHKLTDNLQTVVWYWSILRSVWINFIGTRQQFA